MSVERKLSFGVELELADVDCSRPIPKELGAWECGDKKNENGYYLGKETCIMNTDGTVVDPDKIKCVKGGEIHVVPSYSIVKSSILRKLELLIYFKEFGIFIFYMNYNQRQLCIGK